VAEHNSKGGKSFEMTWTGTDKMRRKLKAMGAAGSVTLAKAVVEEAEILMTDIKENHVPRDLGGLASSGFVKPLFAGVARAFAVKFGFGGTAAPYAWPIHENPRAGHTEGVSPSGKRYKHWAQVGHWKYLEGPMNTWTKGLTSRIGQRVFTAWKKALG